jgi:hypothetical protein
VRNLKKFHGIVKSLPKHKNPRGLLSFPPKAQESILLKPLAQWKNQA